MSHEMFLLFAFPQVSLIFPRLHRIDITVTDHSSVKQSKKTFSKHKLPLNGTRNFRTSAWDFLLNGTCTFRTSDWDFWTSFFSFKNVWHLNDTVWYLKNSKVALKRFWTMADTNKTLVFSAAVRGFNVCQDFWSLLKIKNWNVFSKGTTYLTCSQLKRVV